MLELSAENQGDQPSPNKLDAARLAHAWSLFVDCVTASVVTDFDARGIDSILLKGPAFAQLFYDNDWDRVYTDTDLLVQRADRAHAERALEASGFARIDRDEEYIGPAPMYAHTFHRPLDGALIDLHWRLPSAGASPEDVWSALRGHAMQIPVGGRLITALDPSASGLLVALHNAHHGTGRPGTLNDLNRAVDRLGFGEWLDATCLADQIGAAEPFAAGLRLTPVGYALADRLELGRPVSVEMWLKVNPSTYGAWALDRLTQSNTIRGRLRICLQVAMPPPVIMYRFFPLARRGRAGLALAYVVRPVRLAFHAAPALRDWIRARRALYG